MIKGHGVATLQRKIEEVIELAVERRRTRNRQLSCKGIGLAQQSNRQSRVIIEKTILFGRCNECSFRYFSVRLCGFLETDHKDKCKRRNVSGSSLTAKHQQVLPIPCQ
nr:MAG TPA: hypothetical protein [Caudoviricetes sp.]